MHTAEAFVIGGSAGAIGALGEILCRLPAQFPPVLVVVHLMPNVPSLLSSLFATRTALRVYDAEPSRQIEPGCIYFAPPDYHLLVEPDRRCALSIEPPVHFSRPSIDVLFESAADVYGAGVVGVVLTGASSDGARGLAAIREQGGGAVVQDPQTAEVGVMPRAAITAVPSARVVPLSSIASALRSYLQVS